MSERSDDFPGERLADRFASELKDRWQRGEPADIAAVLSEFPELKQHKSVVLDLACCEYQQRVERGESLGVEEFCRRFPSFQRSLCMLIEVQRWVDQNSGLDPFEERVAWPAPGTEFLGFTLLAELGRGAFGRVFLASETALGGRLVVLKLALHGGQEAETLGRLRHPNIMPVYSVQEEPSTALTAICMPYLGRATLSDVLDCAFVDGRPPTRARVILETMAARHADSELAEAAPWERILRKGSYVDGVIYLGIQLADALAYTHARGICHHDLKPSNVLIAMDGRPLLLDFNLSFDERTHAHRFGGTLPYMAPEQLRHMASHAPEGPAPNTSEDTPQVFTTSEVCVSTRADPRSDLFSLGVILYEVLAGVLPFGSVPRGRSLEDTARRLLDRQRSGPQPLREKNPRVDRRLAQTIEQCLAFDPDCRPQSAASLADCLRRELAPVRRARRWVADHRRPVWGTVFALLLVALCWGAFLVFRPAYHVRQLRFGLEYYHQGRYELAIACFDSAIRAAPEDPSDAMLARGKAYLKLNNPRAAFEDFRAACEREPNAPAAAGMGYCLSQFRSHKEAVQYYRMAAALGHRSAALLNNLGFSYRRLHLFDDAEVYLKQAAELDGGLQAAHHNLAALYLERARQGQPLSPAARFHVSKAIEIGPPSADLYCTASLIEMLAVQDDAQGVQRALGYLEKAHALGLDVATVRSNPLFGPLRDLAQFQRLLTTPSGAKPTPPVLLVDPL